MNLTDSKINQQPHIWSIGGSGTLDVAADIRACGANNVRCSTLISTTGVSQIPNEGLSSDEIFKQQWSSMASSVPPSVIKVGLMTDMQQTQWLVEKLSTYKKYNPAVSIVYQPMLSIPVDNQMSGIVASPAHTLLINEELLPLVDILMLNTDNLRVLTNESQYEEQCDERYEEQYQPAVSELANKHQLTVVLEKVNHATNCTYHHVVFTDNDASFTMKTPYLNHQLLPAKTCTLSSLITCFIAKTYSLPDALIVARAILSQATYVSHPLGGGRDDVFHLSPLSNFKDLPIISPLMSDDTSDNMGVFAPCGDEQGLVVVIDNIASLEQNIHSGLRSFVLDCTHMRGENIDKQVAAAVLIGLKSSVQVVIKNANNAAIKYNAYGIEIDANELSTCDLAVINNAGIRLGVRARSLYHALLALEINPSYLVIEQSSESHLPSYLDEMTQFELQLLKHRCPLVLGLSYLDYVSKHTADLNCAGLQLDSLHCTNDKLIRRLVKLVSRDLQAV